MVQIFTIQTSSVNDFVEGHSNLFNINLCMGLDIGNRSFSSIYVNVLNWGKKKRNSLRQNIYYYVTSFSILSEKKKEEKIENEVLVKDVCPLSVYMCLCLAWVRIGFLGGQKCQSIIHREMKIVILPGYWI